MNPYISKSLACQIVNTVSDLCGQNVNFIDCSGIIFASTNEERIGNFHEIGRQAAVSGKVIEVTETDRFTGTQQGVNLPVYHNHKVIAVIGITGNPDEIRKYAHLAERITRLLIREKELDAFHRTEAEKKNHILQGLIEHKDIHPDYLAENFSRWGIQENSRYHLIRIYINHENTLSGSHAYSHNDTAFLLPEPVIHQLFQKLGITLYTFMYPDQYLAVLEHFVFENSRHVLKAFPESSGLPVQIAVGNAVPIRQISDSYDESETVLQSLLTSGRTFAEFSDLTLELILSSAPARIRSAYLSKTVSSLSDKDLDLLNTYFKSNMSLKDTCEKAFLHKNTLQYRLNQIYHRCGYNPRSFQDAVVLYMALKLSGR
nr:sugar diacid recognition domain-containing protein [uncultured Blautia sp.]